MMISNENARKGTRKGTPSKSRGRQHGTPNRPIGIKMVSPKLSQALLWASSETLKYKETPNRLDLLFVYVFRRLTFPIVAYHLITKQDNSICCDCAENPMKYQADRSLEILWAPELHPQSAKWCQRLTKT